MHASTLASAATLRHSRVIGAEDAEPGRRLSGKSSKSLGLATYDDYKWIVGKYTNANLPATHVHLRDGVAYKRDFNSTSLEITPLDEPQGLAFQAIITSVGLTQTFGNVYFRETLEGVASYNLDTKVPFYSDYIEFRFDENAEWTPLDNEQTSDVSKMTCSKLAKVPSGKSIVCDGYANDVWELPGGVEEFEVLSSVVWTEYTNEDEEAY